MAAALLLASLALLIVALALGVALLRLSFLFAAWERTVRIKAAALHKTLTTTGLARSDETAEGSKLTLPEDIAHWTEDESEPWATEDLQHEARELYAELGDWEAVRQAMGVGFDATRASARAWGVAAAGVPDSPWADAVARSAPEET